MKADLCSKYRNHIYGIATLAILIVHAKPFQIWPNGLNILDKLFTYGGFGVPVFAFLGGIGSYFSLQKNSVKQYYLNRWKRTFVPYLFIASIFYIFPYILYSFKPLEFLYKISTLSFWFGHKGLWYIAMLIPVYLCMPFWNFYIKRGNDILKTIIFCLIWFVFGVFLNEIYPETYHYFSNVWKTIFCFFVGYYYGKKVYNKQQISYLWIIIPPILYFTQGIFSRFMDRAHYFMEIPLRDACFAFCGISIAFILSLYLRKIPCAILKSFDSLGKVSLESYCWNAYLCAALIWIRDGNSFYTQGMNGIIFYVLFVCVLGIILSFATSRFFSFMRNK